MKRLLIGVAAVSLVALMSGPAFAGTQTDAVIAAHIQPHLQKGDACLQAPQLQSIACSSYTVTGDLNTSYDLYLMLAKGVNPPGLAGLSCGIMYNGGTIGASTMTDQFGVDVFGWTLCTSGLEFPNSKSGAVEDEWPASGGGNRITWNAVTDCQTTGPGSDGVQCCAGFFYVFAYSTDYFQITENLNLVSGPELQVGDCNNSVTDLLVTQAGFIQFSSGGVNQGCNPCIGPCQPIAVETTTWGKMKQRY